MITKEKISSGYVQMPNEIFRDNISLQSIGLYGAIRSMGPYWKIYQKPFAQRFGISPNTLKKYINELINKGWVSRTPKRNKLGIFIGGYDYVIHNTKKLSTTLPVDNNAAESKVDSPRNENTPDWQNLIHNKDSDNNKYIGARQSKRIISNQF